MPRARPLSLLLFGLLLLLLGRGIARLRSPAVASRPAPSRAADGRSALAARTDPALLAAGAPGAAALPDSADLDAIRTAIRSAGATVYLPAMFIETDSVLRRWADADAASLRVAYEIGGVPGWTGDDQAIAREAFQSWERVGLPVHFVEVLDTAGAQLLVRWVPRFVIDRTGQTDLTWDADGRIHRAVIQLALDDSGGRAISPEGLRAVALHEVGHALGLPHSDDDQDIMFPTTRRPVLTDRDIATIQLLYRLPPVSLK